MATYSKPSFSVLDVPVGTSTLDTSAITALQALQGDLHRSNQSVREPEAGTKLATDSVFKCE